MESYDNKRWKFLKIHFFINLCKKNNFSMSRFSRSITVQTTVKTFYYAIDLLSHVNFEANFA